MKKPVLALAAVLMLALFGCGRALYETVPEESTTEMTGVSEDGAMDSGELTRLYQTLFSKIYAEDSGLNHDITVIAVDFSGIENLTAEEKALLVSQLPKNGCIIREATSAQLKAEGLIDGDGNFTNGVLISINAKTTGENSVSFSVSKFRSGLGAIGYFTSTAVWENGKWTISYGGEWIS